MCRSQLDSGFQLALFWSITPFFETLLLKLLDLVEDRQKKS